jgi:hypothetical protein
MNNEILEKTQLCASTSKYILFCVCMENNPYVHIYNVIMYVSTFIVAYFVSDIYPITVPYF